MHGHRPGGCLGFFLGAFFLFLALFEWDEFLLKPFEQMGVHGPGWVLKDLAKLHSTTYGQAGQGWLFLLASLAITAITFALLTRAIKGWSAYLNRVDAPVSILETIIHIRMLDPDFKLTQINRSQIIHANKSKVDAYHYSQAASFGTIKLNSWKFESLLNGSNISTRPLVRYTGKTLEVIERFERHLPTNPIVSYMPRSFLLPMFRIFGRFQQIIVTRNNVSINEDEYSHSDPMFQLKCVRYPAYNVEIIIDFPEQSNIKANDVQGFLITDNIVENIDVIRTSSLQPEAGRLIYSVKRRRLSKHQTIRLQWVNS